MRMYSETDIDHAYLEGRRIAVLGYGSQGRAQALNLKDSGHDVVVGLRPGSASRQRAQADGLAVAEPQAAAAGAALVAFLTPDMTHPELYASIEPQLAEGTAILFAHGFNIHYRRIEPRADLDIVLIAPKGAGDLVRRFPNVLVMRTFSKAMGLAGLRLGYLMAHPAVIAELEKPHLPFLVDRLSESAGLAMLERDDVVAERVRTLSAEREKVLAALAGRPEVETVPSAANFFIMRTPLAPPELIPALLAEGVRVRDVSAYPALAGWVRVSVGLPAENRAFLDALNRILDGRAA